MLSKEPFQATKEWILTGNEGTKTVYVKFYTQYGQPSEVVSDNIVYTSGKTSTPTTIPSSFVFSKNLYYGTGDQDVVYLKIILTSDGCVSGLANTDYFGPKTLEGVKCFQNKHKEEISSFAGYSIKSTGFVGRGTGDKLNKLLDEMRER